MQVSYDLKTEPSLKREKTAFVCVDIQERLFRVMQEQERLLKNANRLLKASEILGFKTFVLEQYPKGLGKSVVQSSIEPLEKLSFSAFGEKRFCHCLQESKIQALVIFGIESHVCVRESAIDAKQRGFETYVVEDSCSSRDLSHHHLAIQELRNAGVRIISSETLFFSSMLHCKEENFKAISALVKD
ncbi:isochorismatase family protein [Helicobacter mesocricetorum]|uniref:isochorismatase family protein n=1 Tax=Helicobacter mesocricetorum TaxID=87012 RepID=UPI000CF019C1|nr:isochorismatase family protein [Helicobacter mesocricetorum]